MSLLEHLKRYRCVVIFSSPRPSSCFFGSFQHFFLFLSLQRLPVSPHKLTCLVLPCVCARECAPRARTNAAAAAPVCPDDVRGRHEEQSETFHHWEHWGEWPGDDSRVPQSCPRRPLRETWHGTKRQPDGSVLIDEELLSALQWFQLGDSFFFSVFVFFVLFVCLSSPFFPNTAPALLLSLSGEAGKVMRSDGGSHFRPWQRIASLLSVSRRVNRVRLHPGNLKGRLCFWTDDTALFYLSVCLSVWTGLRRGKKEKI